MMFHSSLEIDYGIFNNSNADLYYLKVIRCDKLVMAYGAITTDIRYGAIRHNICGAINN